MGWESRQGRGRYYTRTLWQDGRVVRRYLGRGPRAEQAAAEDSRRKAEQLTQREASRARVRDLDAADATLGALDAVSLQILSVALTAAGYGRHDRGAWRKRQQHPANGKLAGPGRATGAVGGVSEGNA